MDHWNSELDRIKQFDKLLDEISPLPSLSDEELWKYSETVIYIQDLLSLVASLPSDKKPPIFEWDDTVSNLWRKLFLKGDDVDRLTFGDLWLKSLIETKDTKRIFKTASAFLASCRNFSLFEEGYEVAVSLLKRFPEDKSAAMANFLNTFASLFYCESDWEKAEEYFRRAKDLGETLSNDECVKWIKCSKEDFIGQEIINIAETHIERGFLSKGKLKEEWISKAKPLIFELEKRNLSEGLKSFINVTKAEFALLIENFSEAEEIIDDIDRLSKTISGPYYYSMATTHARLKAKLNFISGDYNKAYQWIRKALRLVSIKTYPAEDLFVLKDAIKIVRKLFEEEPNREDVELVKDLVLLLEDKDWYTGGFHSRQVAELCLKIGYFLKNDGHRELSILDLEMAGLVHDIGKLRIPWSLLNKIAPITPKEREILKLHAKFGRDILNEIGLTDSAQVVYEHHETMDGKGYPLGKIPSLPASIVGICDVFDASTTLNRRYKIAKGVKEALDEIDSLSNIKYNPHAVQGIKAVAEKMQRR